MKTKRNEDYPNLLYIILLQNLCCINRTHCIEKKLYKILGNIIFYVSLTTIIGFNIYDILVHIRDHTKLKDLSTSIKFSYIFQWILGVELVPLAIAAKQKFTIYEQLKLLGGKCGIIPNIIRNKLTTKDFSKGIGKEIILSLISIIIDTIGLISLEYPASVIITLAVSFAAHDTELLFYSLIIEEFNGKLTTLMDVSAEMGTKMYRHILIAASHYSKDFKFTICLTVISTLATTVIYIGASIVLEGSRAHKVLSYFIWREIRSLFSLWLLCSASFQTRILCSNLVKRLSRRLVFELDSKEKASRGLTKRWLRCVKSSPVRYLNGSCYTLSPTLPLVVLDYTTNYLLIIVQVYPLITSKSKKSQGQSV